MGHLMKYRLKKQIREWSTLFWALAFPLILGTFFNISFGSGDVSENMDQIPVAVVEVNLESMQAKSFDSFLNEMDGDAIKVKSMKEKQAIKALNADKVEGIYYISETPSLTVAKSDLNQSILKAILDSYHQNAKLIEAVATEHPENLSLAVNQIANQKSIIKEVDMGGRTTDRNITYFLALLAYACISGSFMGVSASADAQANLSAIGARRSVTPTNKLAIVLTDMFVLLGIQFVNVTLLSLYIHFILGIDLGNMPVELSITNLFGCMIGISIGLMIGSVSRVSEGIRMGITVLFTLFPAFLAGLMIGNMKDVIEHFCPIINRINPAAVLSDTYYCLSVYNDMPRYTHNLLILGIMSVGFLSIAFFAVRRERYDSI